LELKTGRDIPGLFISDVDTVEGQREIGSVCYNTVNFPLPLTFGKESIS